MNRLNEIRELIAYHRWATAMVLDAVESLPRGAFTRDLNSSFGSMRDTLVHLMSAEWAWLERLGGRSPTAMPEEWKAYELAQIRQRWGEVAHELDGFVARLEESDVDRAVDYRNFAGEPHTSTIGQILRHVVNHASYHRGQVTTMMRQLGAAPPSTDLIRWYRSTPPLPTA